MVGTAGEVLCFGIWIASVVLKGKIINLSHSRIRGQARVFGFKNFPAHARNLIRSSNKFALEAETQQHSPNMITLEFDHVTFTSKLLYSSESEKSINKSFAPELWKGRGNS